MLKKSEFEAIIKENLQKYCPSANLGYKIPENSGRCFDNYYSNEEFDRFLEEMKLPKYMHHYMRYKAGKGGELEESKGKYGLIPPKMASIASSSRFCYLSLRNGGKVIGASGPVLFEVGCEINSVNRIPPQLDACFPEENIYVEVKCQEIFTGHKPVLKEAYWNLIYGENNQFGFPVKEKNGDEEFEIPLNVFGIEKSHSMFDIKQFLCHLMGVASKKGAPETPATLVYLFFIPKTDDNERNKKICEFFGELRDEIYRIFSGSPIKTFVEKNNIKLEAIAECDYIMRDLTEENKLIIYNQGKKLYSEI